MLAGFFIGFVLLPRLSFAAYCTAGVGPKSIGYNNLGAVKLGGASQIIDNGDDCGNQKTGVAEYLDEEADIIPGKTYTIIYESTTCPSTADRLYAHSAVWIDIDQAHVFDKSTYMVTSGFNIVEVIAHLKVPLTAKIGKTRMRIQVAVFPNSTNVYDPCMSFTYGGVKDFTINIVNHTSPTPSPTPRPTAAPVRSMSSGTVALIAIICLIIGCGVGIGVYRYRKADDDMQYGIQDDYSTENRDKDQPAYQTDLQTDL